MTTVVVHNFQTPVSTGNVDITTAKLGGLTPKAAIFYLTQAVTGDTLTAGELWMAGMTDGTTHVCAYATDRDGTAPQASRRKQITGFPIQATTHATTVISCEASFVAWLADGIRLNFTNVTNRYLITAIFFAGNDLQATVLSQSLGTATSNLAITGVGFQPEMLFCVGTAANNAAAIAPSFHCISGFANDNGSSIDQAAHLHVGGDGGATTDEIAAVRDDVFYFGILGGPQTFQYFITVLSMDSDGFTVSRSANPGNDDLLFLALNFGGSSSGHVSVESTPTVGTTWDITSAGFFPEAAGLVSNFIQTVNTVVGTSDAGSFGYHVFDGTNSYTNAWAAEDNIVTPNTSSISNTDAVTLYDDSSTTIEFESTDTDLFTDTGLSIDFSSINSTARQWIFWAIEGQAPPESGRSIVREIVEEPIREIVNSI